MRVKLALNEQKGNPYFMVELSETEKNLLSQGRIALIGFGAQGEAESVNLRKSGVPFVLGLRPEGSSFKKARELGFEPVSIEAALEKADTVVLNLPDQAQAPFYDSNLKQKKIRRLVFAHGFNSHFGLIPLTRSGPLHMLVAPKGAATGLMEFYDTPQSLPAILAIRAPEGWSDADLEQERRWASAYAKAIGCHERGLVWASFKDETECDLFSEQALLCGGVSQLLQQTFEVMVEAGYNPETAYFESLFELKLIVDLIWRRGITGMREKISPTARYGDLTRGSRVVDESVKKRMKEILAEIQSGAFAKEFLNQFGSAEYKQIEAKEKNHPIEKIGAKIREKMSGST